MEDRSDKGQDIYDAINDWFKDQRSDDDGLITEIQDEDGNMITIEPPLTSKDMDEFYFMPNCGPFPTRKVGVLGKENCPECRGTGEYRGLQVIEPCETCMGTGRI